MNANAEDILIYKLQGKEIPVRLPQNMGKDLMHSVILLMETNVLEIQEVTRDVYFDTWVFKVLYPVDKLGYGYHIDELVSFIERHEGLLGEYVITNNIEVARYDFTDN